jgi:hypothetical protein
LEPPVKLDLLALQVVQVSLAYQVTLAFQVPVVRLEIPAELEFLGQ